MFGMTVESVRRFILHYPTTLYILYYFIHTILYTIYYTYTYYIIRYITLHIVLVDVIARDTKLKLRVIKLR